jgi:hypothetical protein
MTANRSASPRLRPAAVKSLHSARRGGETPDYQSLIACLEEAGATLLSLPASGFSPRLRTTTLPILREAAEAYGWSLAQLRPPMPSAARITRMDRAMGYLALIPQDRHVLRRIVGCRALVHPLSGRHLFSWRRLAELLSADHKAVQRWHSDGIRLILASLRRLAEAEHGARPNPPPPPVMTAMPQ